jgi:hypothetical protein
VEAAKLVIDSLDHIALESRASELERLIRRLPPITQVETTHIFWRAVGDVYFSRLPRERNSNRLLDRAWQAYASANYSKGVRDVQKVLAEQAFAEGAGSEEQARHADGLLRQERLFRQAAVAYEYYWPKEAKRCERLAKQLAESADRLAKHVIVPPLVEDVINAFLAVPETRGGSLTDHTGRGSAKIRTLEAAGGWLVGETFSLGWAVDLATERLTDRIVERSGIPGNLTILRHLVRRAVIDIGDTSSYCPTPIEMPSSVITTKWRKTLLALLVTAVAGAPLGLISAAPELQTVLTAILGAETALAINLVSTYLTRQRGPELSQLLTKYNEQEALLILHLLRQPRTALQLAEVCHRTVTQTRHDLAKLERDGVVKKNYDRPHGAFVWSLVDTDKASG